MWLKNFHISEYVYSSIFNHNPDRPKKLLLHREQIKRLQRKVEEKGYTEETDYQFQAMKNGFEAKVAIDTYVFHKAEVCRRCARRAVPRARGAGAILPCIYDHRRDCVQGFV